MEHIKILLRLRHKKHLVMVRENIMVWLKRPALIAAAGNVPSSLSKQMVLLPSNAAGDASTSQEKYPDLVTTN